jgi:hypothetical protein
MLPVAPSNYSARDTAITQRPTSTALFVVDSEDRFANYTAARSATQTSPYDFSINLPASLMNGFFTRVGISEVVFPWAIPNVNTKTNKIVVRVEGPYSGGLPYPIVDTVVTLTKGFYTPAQLAAEVQLVVRATVANMANFFMVYGPTSAVSNNPAIFEYGSGDGDYGVAFLPMTPLSTAWPYPDTSRQLFDVLGLSDANNVPDGNAFSGFTFAQATRYVDIICPQLTYNQALKDTGSQKVMRDTLCRIYIVDPANIQSTIEPSSAVYCPPGCAPTIIYRNFATPKQIQWLPNQPIVGSLKFEVYDDEGDILSITESVDASVPPSRLNWSMSMLVSEN